MSSVDIIVPCYRYGHFLRQCVGSILTQSHSAVRVVIIDDASPDDSAVVGNELAREDSRVTFIQHEVNKGHIATYNEGIDWVSGDYLLLLSADDYLLPGALERAVSLLDAHPDVGFVFGRALNLSPDGVMTPTPSYADSDALILTGEQFLELSWPQNVVPTPTAVVRTSLQKRVGGYNPALPHAGDLEMWLRLSAHASVGVLNAPQAVYRKHSENMSEGYYGRSRLPDFLQRKATLDFFLEKSLQNFSDSGRVRRAMERALGLNAAELANNAFSDGQFDAARQLAECAIDLCPEVTGTLTWKKYVFKRWLGEERWLAMRRVLQSLGWTRGESTN